MVLALIALLVLIVVGLGVVMRVRRSRGTDESAEVQDGGTQDLRMGILTRTLFAIDATDLGISYSEEEARCAVMDYGVKAGCVTLVACGDGTVSLYYSSGGGILGLGGNEAVRNPALRFLEVAESFRGQLSKAEEFPLPQAGEMVFYWVDAASTWSSGPISEKALRKRQHPLHPVAYSAQDVLTQIRLNS